MSGRLGKHGCGRVKAGGPQTENRGHQGHRMTGAAAYIEDG